ncbi:NADP-dependent malic enzyme, mitochondrial-like, partial [Sinocyclocheilus rhinocerous]|uniref:NADP-dependent malic enzyme, mitochondrial-like n=1 Tax=Sinocyclocheilus rhinocerous TaxID=307959 RepID=UPI0007B9973E
KTNKRRIIKFKLLCVCTYGAIRHTVLSTCSVYDNHQFDLCLQAIAELVTEKDLAEGRLYPPLNSIREVSIKLAVKIVEYAYKNKMATLHPEPHDKEAFVHSLIFSTEYEEFAVDSYSWPENAMAVQMCKL